VALQEYEKDFGPVIRREIEKIKADHRSGATKIALDVLNLAGRIAGKRDAKSADRRRQATLAFIDEIIRAHPQMAILYYLRRKWRKITTVYNMTTSYSSSVARALVAASSKRVRVVVSESRPMLEGRELAALLEENRISTTLIVDAALGLHIPEASAVVLGADAITPEYFVNKIGSLALCLLAREHDVPVLVLADEFRLTGKNKIRRKQVNHPSDEIIPQPAPYAVDNRYFDFISMKLVKSVIFDGRIVTPRQLFKGYSRRETSWPA